MNRRNFISAVVGGLAAVSGVLIGRPAKAKQVCVPIYQPNVIPEIRLEHRKDVAILVYDGHKWRVTSYNGTIDIHGNCRLSVDAELIPAKSPESPQVTDS